MTSNRDEYTLVVSGMGGYPVIGLEGDSLVSRHCLCALAALRRFGQQLDRRFRSNQLPYEARSLIHRGKWVFSGDKSGALASIRLDNMPVQHVSSISDFSVDGLAYIRELDSESEQDDTRLALVAGTRGGELLQVVVRWAKDVGISHQSSCIRASGIPITAIRYDEILGLLIVAMEDGAIDFYRDSGESREWIHVGSSTVAPYPIALGSIAEHVGERTSGQIFCATKLGQIYRGYVQIADTGRSSSLSSDLTTWTTIDSTVNSLETYVKRDAEEEAIEAWLIVGSNHGVSWLNTAPAARGKGPELISMPSSQRVVSVQVIRLDSDGRSGCESWLLIGYQNGRLRLLPISRRGMMLDLHDRRTSREGMEVYTDRAPCLIHASTSAASTADDGALICQISCGLRDHTIEVIGVQGRDTSLNELEILMCMSPGLRIREALVAVLDEYPDDRALRRGIALFLCRALATGEFPSLRLNLTSADAVALILRIVRSSELWIPARILRVLSDYPDTPDGERWVDARTVTELAEYIEKYVLDGATFFDKRLCLRSLVYFNSRQVRPLPADGWRNALDVVIYASLLLERGGLDLVHRLPIDGYVWDIFQSRLSRLYVSTSGGRIYELEVCKAEDPQPQRAKILKSWELPTSDLDIEPTHGNYARAIMDRGDQIVGALWDGRRFVVDKTTEVSEGTAEPAVIHVEVPDNEVGEPARSSVYSCAPDTGAEQSYLVGLRSGEIWFADSDLRNHSIAWKTQVYYGENREYHGKRATDEGQLYRPIWDLETFTSQSGLAFVAAASHDGHLYLFRRRESGLELADKTAFPSFPNSVRHCISASGEDRLVAGGEGGLVCCFRIRESAAGKACLEADWAYYTPSSAIRAVARVPDTVGGGWICGALQGTSYWLDDSGELVASLDFGVPCNAIAYLGTRDSKAGFPVASFAIGGEAGGEVLGLYELSNPSKWQSILWDAIERFIEKEGDAETALRKAASVRMPPNILREIMLQKRYNAEDWSSQKLGPQDSIRDIDDIAARVRILVGSEITDDTHATLLSLICIVFRMLASADDADEYQILKAARAYEQCADQWSTFGAVRNDEVRLAPFEVFFQYASIDIFEKLMSDEVAELLEKNRLHPVPHALLTLLDHPDPRVQFRTLACFRSFSRRHAATGRTLSFGVARWLIETLGDRIGRQFPEDTQRICWRSIEFARTLACLRENLRIPSALLGYYISKRRCSPTQCSMIASQMKGDAYSVVSEQATLSRAIRDHHIDDMRVSAGIYADELERTWQYEPSNSATELKFRTDYLEILKTLASLLAARSLRTWVHEMEFPETLFVSRFIAPGVSTLLLGLRSMYRQVGEYAKLEYAEKSAKNKILSSRIQGVLNSDESILETGLIAKVIRRILQEWQSWLAVERQIHLPLQSIESFQQVSADAEGRVPLLGPYQDAVREIFRRIHFSLGAIESHLYDFRPKQNYYYIMREGATIHESNLDGHHIECVERHCSSGSSPDERQQLLAGYLGWDHDQVSCIECIREERLYYVMIFSHNRANRDAILRAETLRRLPQLLEAHYLLANRLQIEGDILGVAAHQLQNPLHTLKMGLDVLLDGPLLTDQGSQAKREVLVGRTDLTVSIINSIVDSQRLESELIPTKPDKYDLAEVIDDPLRIARQIAIPEGITVHSYLPGVAVPVLVDRGMIRDALNMILGNAIKYSDRGGDVVVNVSARDDQVSIDISDDGIGIPPEEMTEIFGLYFRGRIPTAKRYDGSGIGLTMAWRYVRANGGYIQPHSDGLGKGSRFTVTLPLCEEA